MSGGDVRVDVRGRIRGYLGERRDWQGKIWEMSREMACRSGGDVRHGVRGYIGERMACQGGSVEMSG